jgi:hypothetical protein
VGVLFCYVIPSLVNHNSLSLLFGVRESHIVTRVLFPGNSLLTPFPWYPTMYYRYYDCDCVKHLLLKDFMSYPAINRYGCV